MKTDKIRQAIDYKKISAEDEKRRPTEDDKRRSTGYRNCQNIQVDVKIYMSSSLSLHFSFTSMPTISKLVCPL